MLFSPRYERASEGRENANIVSDLLFLPQTISDRTLGHIPVVGDIAHYLTHPLFLGLATLAGVGYQTGLFNNLGGAAEPLNWTGERVSAGAQNFWNWMGSKFSGTDMAYGYKDAAGQIYKPGTGLFGTPNPTTDLIT